MVFEGILESVTEEFIESFKTDPKAYTGIFARLVAIATLPAGVDPNDPRVIQIVDKCKQAYIAKYGKLPEK
jgi:hypothetical protein